MVVVAGIDVGKDSLEVWSGWSRNVSTTRLPASACWWIG